MPYDRSSTNIRQMFRQLSSKIQFGLYAQGDYKTLSLPLLRKDKKDKIQSKAYHQAYKCSGIKHCEYVPEHMLRRRHKYSYVKPNIFETLRKEAGHASDTTSASEFLKRETENWYNGFLRFWNRQSAGHCFHPESETWVCSNQTPVIFERHEPPVTFIGCLLASDFEPWHTAQAISTYTARIYMPYLYTLVAHGIYSTNTPIQSTFTYINYATSRRTTCGFDHP